MKKKLVLLFLMVSSVCFGQNLKISQLPVATTPLSGTELIPIVQSGITKQTTVGSIGVSAPCCGLITGNPTENGNFFVGTSVGNTTLSGGNNVITGYVSGVALTTGYSNAVYGNNSLTANTVGYSNTALGTDVLPANISGSLNVAVGSGALSSNITGSELTAIGAQTDVATDGLSNSIALGSGAVITASNQFVVGSASTPVSGWVINNVPYTMPAAQGAASTVLTNNGSGTLTWTALPASGITSIGIGNLGDAVGFAPNPLTSNGDINIVWLGSMGQYINGMGNLANLPNDTPLLAGSNISISRSISGNTISASGGGGSPSLTSTYIGYGNGSNVLTGDDNFTRSAYGITLQDNGTNRNLFIGATTTGNGSSSGSANIGVGYLSLNNITSGINNCAFGVASLQSNNAGSNNIAIGEAALIDNTTGDFNIAIGQSALTSNSTGDNLILIGHSAATSASGLNNSIGLGYNASVTTSNQFVVAPSIVNWNIGGVPYVLPSSQGASNTYLKNDGSGNLSWTSASGSAALNSGYIGYGNGSNVLTGDANFIRTSWGIELQDNSSNYNLFIGTLQDDAGNNTTSGTDNIALGSGALLLNTTGFLNTAIGENALQENTSGSGNLAIGFNTIPTNLTGGDLIAIGHELDVSTDGLTNSVGIGTFGSLTPLITESNQFVVSPSIVNWNIGGVAYVLPSSQGASNTVLTNDGSGNLSWASAGGGSSSLTSSYIGYGSGSNTLTGSTNFVYNSSNSTLALMGYEGVDMFDTILYCSSTTHSSAVSFLAGNMSLGMDAFGISDGGCTIGSITIPAHTFLCTDSKYSLAGVNYVVPTSQGAASTVLTNDGSGNLSWATVSGTPITLTTTGTSGAATLSSGTLNIPQYSGGGGNNITLLGSLIGADLNYSGDQSITLSGGTTYVITNIVYTNASTNLTESGILQTQINTGASLSGNYIEYENEFVTLMSTSSQFMDWTVAGSISNMEHIQPYAWLQPSSSIMGYTVTSPIYFSDLVLNGSAATCDIYVYGYVLN